MVNKRRRTYYDWEQVPLMMTAEEVAKLLRLSLVTVRNHIRDGKIPSVKVGDRVFVSRDVFRHSIEETEQEVA